MDSLLPNTDSVNQTTFTPNAQDATAVTVANGARFRVGDQVRPDPPQPAHHDVTVQAIDPLLHPTPPHLLRQPALDHGRGPADPIQ